MTQEERIAQLKKENAELRAELAAAYERLERVEKLLAKDSHNSKVTPCLRLWLRFLQTSHSLSLGGPE